MRDRKRVVFFIAVIQTVLFLGHYFLYQTWTLGTGDSSWAVKLTFALLSVSFVAASVLAFRYTNSAVRVFYRAAAIWTGLLSFLFIAAIFSWIVFGVGRLVGWNANFHRIVEVLFGAALAAGVYGVFNASWTRITRTTVRLANLPRVVARADGGTDQRRPSGACAEWQFSAAHGGEDFEGRAGRHFYCRGSLRRNGD